MSLNPLAERVDAVVTKVTTESPGTPATPAGSELTQKVQDAAPQAAPDTQKTPAPQDDSHKKEYINLAKLESRLQAEKRQFRQAVDEFRRAQNDASEREKYWADLPQRAKTDPAGVAKELGMSYSDWTNQILNDGDSTADQKIQGLAQELQNLRNEAQEERERSRQMGVARLNSEAMATVQNFRGQINEYIGSNAEQYAGIQSMSLEPMVYDLIREHYKVQGKLLSVKEASDLLEESIVNAVDKFVTSKKWTERASAKAKGTPKGVSLPPAKESKSDSVMTISNDMTAEAGTPSPAKRLNMQERIARAVASAEAKKAARI